MKFEEHIPFIAILILLGVSFVSLIILYPGHAFTTWIVSNLPLVIFSYLYIKNNRKISKEIENV